MELLRHRGSCRRSRVESRVGARRCFVGYVHSASLHTVLGLRLGDSYREMF